MWCEVQEGAVRTTSSPGGTVGNTARVGSVVVGEYREGGQEGWAILGILTIIIILIIIILIIIILIFFINSIFSHQNIRYICP